MTDPQRVMVTAAGSGIGRAIAHAFADAGATVHICDTDSALLELATADYTKGVSRKRGVRPEETAAMAVFLASPAASMISGQAITVDGHTETFHSE